MSRLAVLASLMLVAQHESALRTFRPRRPLPQEFVVETFPATLVAPQPRPIALVRHQANEHAAQFGLIPTDVSVHTKLLPTTWNAKTVLVDQAHSEFRR